MKKNLIVLCSALVMLLILSACGSYYKVKDPSTDKVYYTEDIKNKGKSAIQFEDTVTGSKVILQNSEIMEIDKKEFKKAITPEPEKENKTE